MNYTERQWQELVERAAAANGWRTAVVAVARSEAGWPDLTLLHPAGRLVFAELKTNAGRVSLKQARIHADLAAAGHPVYVWRPSDVDHVRAVLGSAGTLPSSPPAPRPELVLTSRPRAPKSYPSDAILEAVTTIVADYYGLTTDELRGRDRTARVAWPRQVAMKLARELALTLPTIGRYYNRNHTTALHAIRLVDRRTADVPDLLEQIRDYLRAQDYEHDLAPN
jgi:hypothetical protein